MNYYKIAKIKKIRKNWLLNTKTNILIFQPRINMVCRTPGYCPFCLIRPSKSIYYGYCVECEAAGVFHDVSHLPVCKFCKNRHFDATTHPPRRKRALDEEFDEPHPPPRKRAPANVEEWCFLATSYKLLYFFLT